MSSSTNKNLPAVSPYITVKDVNASAEFYKKAFRFEITELFKNEEGDCWHGELSYKNQLIMLGKEGAYGGSTKAPITSQVESPMSLYLYCDDVDEFYKSAVAAGAISLVAPEDMFWGDRMCKLKDLDGYAWAFGQQLSVN